MIRRRPTSELAKFQRHVSRCKTCRLTMMLCGIGNYLFGEVSR